jgi:chorismate--pyruvate lyase
MLLGLQRLYICTTISSNILYYCILQIILLSDGSVTRHLQLMSGIPAEVECLEMRALSRLESQPESGLIHPTAHALSGQLVQRQVLLHLSDRAYVYAASWWEADTVDSYLK